MSLGFNPNRRHRTSNLPGAVNITLVRAPMSARPSAEPKRRSPVAPSLPPARASPQARPPASLPAAPAPEASTDEHWVYATLAQPAVPGKGAVAVPEALQAAGERVLVVYPMEADAADGRVSVRVKHAHPVTGQLAYAWIVAYDPNTETRYLIDFSLRP